MQIVTFKDFVENTLGGRLWVAPARGIARAYFGDGYQQAFVEVALADDNTIDVLEGSRTDAIIKARSIPSANWLASQKKQALEMYRPSVLAAIAFLQLRGEERNGELVDRSAHEEEWLELGDGLAVALTDSARVGGVKVGADGAYLVKDGRLWVPSAETAAA